MYCLDTNIIIDFLRNRKEVVERVRRLLERGDVSVTTISLCELYKGVHLSRKANTELFLIDSFAQSVNILDLNLAICRRFGEMYSSLEKNGKMIDELDVMIATIADANNHILITQDKHFKNTGVRLEVW